MKNHLTNLSIALCFLIMTGAVMWDAGHVETRDTVKLSDYRAGW